MQCRKTSTGANILKKYQCIKTVHGEVWCTDAMSMCPMRRIWSIRL